VKAKRELKRREESGYPRSNLIKGSEALLSEQQNISSAQIEGISLFNEDANSNDILRMTACRMFPSETWQRTTNSKGS
jgi:hypothetical protein